MSFLSALFEQSPSVSAGRPTKRFNYILEFLQKASRIVPMESIVFAIASCENLETACKCAQAFLSTAHTSSIPISRLMAVGCSDAMHTLIILRAVQTRSLTLSDVSRYRYALSVSRYRYALSVSRYRYAPITASLSEHREELNFRFPEIFQTKIVQRKRKKLSASALPQTSALTLDLDESSKVSLLQEFDQENIIRHFSRFSSMIEDVHVTQHNYDLICGRNIGETYPISKAVSPNTVTGALTPLPQILQKARQELAAYSKSYRDTQLGSIATENCDMLKRVNNIVDNDLKPCLTMLGGFMEQQIRVPLVNNPLDTAKALRTVDNSGAVGVWALFALTKKDIANILSSKKHQALVIQIAKFVEGNTEKQQENEQATSYNAKLQFLLQGMNKTITCSSDYISYSLERELLHICKERNITVSSDVNFIVDNWDTKFKATALVLVPKLYRPLLARWLIWALHIHQLRQGLASYTTVGVIGLVNSGKSTLVNKVFKIEVG